MMTASLVFFFINLAIFFIFTAFVLSKYILQPDRWKAHIANPGRALFFGTFPMGACTLLNVAVDVIHTYFRYGGKRFLYLLWGMWWVVVILGCACCWVGVYAMCVPRPSSHFQI